jgi:hypothetical protein
MDLLHDCFLSTLTGRNFVNETLIEDDLRRLEFYYFVGASTFR